MPTENKFPLKQQRAEHVNQAIRIIADHGSRFFCSQASNRYTSMKVDYHGKVWFIDDYSGKRIFTHETVGVAGGAASATAARCDGWLRYSATTSVRASR